MADVYASAFFISLIYSKFVISAMPGQNKAGANAPAFCLSFKYFITATP